jgi:molecular chaperone GrpE
VKKEKAFEETALPEEAPAVEPGLTAEAAEPRSGAPVGGVPMEPPEEAQRRLEGQLRESQDRHLRLAAEFDNFRKRIARERIELADRAQAALVMRLAEVLDDMDRVVGSAAGTSGETMLQGMQLVDRKLRKELEAAGLERIEPVGQGFDPTLHEAVSVIAPPTPEQDHLVSAVFQVGYRFKGNLVRPARVQVYASGGHA